MGVRPQESREQALESQLVAARWSSLQGALEEAEQIIQDSLAQIDDPAHIGCTSSAGPSLSPRVGRSLAPPARLNVSALLRLSLQTTWRPGVRPLWTAWSASEWLERVTAPTTQVSSSVRLCQGVLISSLVHKKPVAMPSSHCFLNFAW